MGVLRKSCSIFTLTLAFLLFGLYLSVIGASQTTPDKTDKEASKTEDKKTEGETGSDKSVTIDTVRPVLAPAFTLLDISPSSVESPDTPKALAASLVDAIDDENNFLRRNLAIEFAPYWLFDHPGLTFDGYYYPKPILTILQNASLSIATSELKDVANSSGVADEEGDMVKGTSLGIGFRTLILDGRPSTELEGRKNSLVKQMDGALTFEIELYDFIEETKVYKITTKSLEDMKGELEKFKSARPGKPEEKHEEYGFKREDIEPFLTEYPSKLKPLEYREFIGTNFETEVQNALGKDMFANFKVLIENYAIQKDMTPESLVETLEKEDPEKLQKLQEIQKELEKKKRKAQEIALKIQELDKKRVGFLLEIAAAQTIDLPDDSFGKREAGRSGIWLTPSYKLEDSSLELIGVGRYIRDRAKMKGSKDVIDYGGRLLWRYRRIGVSGEYLRRINATPSDNGSDQYGIYFEFRLTNDLYLTAKYQKDFNRTDDEEEEDNVAVLFGISFDISEDPTLLLK